MLCRLLGQLGVAAAGAGGGTAQVRPEPTLVGVGIETDYHAWDPDATEQRLPIHQRS